MGVDTTIRLDRSTIDPAIAEVLDLLKGRTRKTLNSIAARHVVVSVKRYHRKYDAAGKWRKGGGGGSTFGELITKGWNVGKVTDTGVVVENAGPHIRQKVYGGTIKPTEKEALTIPLIPEAKGRRARLYESVTGRKLFKPKGKNVLMEATADGGVRAVYAIRASVFQKPWPGAMPPTKHFLDPFVQSLKAQIAEAL